MFTYFYNKFRPVNSMYFIKCCVNSSLHNSGCCISGTLDHCFITTHSIHKEGNILQIYFCAIFRETRHHAQTHIISGALCPFFGREKNTHGRADELVISLASVCCGDF
jgi:hypothetical protein